MQSTYYFKGTLSKILDSGGLSIKEKKAMKFALLGQIHRLIYVFRNQLICIDVLGKSHEISLYATVSQGCISFATMCIGCKGYVSLCNLDGPFQKG